jgi:hypothetical protein
MLVDEGKIGGLAMDAAVLVDAFEEARKELGLEDRNNLEALFVAKLIISFAKDGERDVMRLRELTLVAMRGLKQTIT